LILIFGLVLSTLSRLPPLANNKILFPDGPKLEIYCEFANSVPSTFTACPKQFNFILYHLLLVYEIAAAYLFDCPYIEAINKLL